jgi:hypothetical protein
MSEPRGYFQQVTYWQKRAEKAQEWSKAWKQTAKLHRGFYQIMVEKAGEWQGKCFKAERDNAALRARVEELEAQLHPVGCQDVYEYYLDEDDNETISASQCEEATSHSAGAGGGVYTFGGKDTETR